MTKVNLTLTETRVLGVYYHIFADKASKFWIHIDDMKILAIPHEEYMKIKVNKLYRILLCLVKKGILKSTIKNHRRYFMVNTIE